MALNLLDILVRREHQHQEGQVGKKVDGWERRVEKES